jgi:hypothetical protein
MTGLLIVLAGIALLIAALSPAHHRSATPFRLGADLAEDRDHARLRADLTAAAQRQERGPRRVGRLLGLAGSAVPFHRLSWR